MNALDENWNLFAGLLPPSRQQAARLSGAVEGLRKFDSVEGRLCAVRKSQQATVAAEHQLDRREYKNQIHVRPETREYAHHVLVVTTLRAVELGAAEVLESYRSRCIRCNRPWLRK